MLAKWYANNRKGMRDLAFTLVLLFIILIMLRSCADILAPLSHASL